MPTPEDLLDMIETHLQHAGIGASSFGMSAVGDPNFVRNLRAGREPRRKTVERVLAFLRSAGSPQASLKPGSRPTQPQEAA